MIGAPLDNVLSLDSAIRRSGRIVIVSHIHPDGDAVGSVTAMWSYLHERCGKDASIILPDAPPETLRFLFDGFDIKSGLTKETGRLIREADLIMALDLNAFRRTDCLEQALKNSEAFKVLIDHHPGPEESEFDLVFSRTDISSASEHIYHILKTLGNGEALPLHCATALMAGMTTDTNNFANSVFPSTLEMAADLLAEGVDRDGLIREIYNSGRAERVRAWSHMLDRKLVLMDCGAAYMVLDKETSRSFGLVEGETDGLVNIPLQIKEVLLSALITEEDGYFRISLRSKEGVNVNALAAASFHGGGHVRASGGRLFIPQDIPDRTAVASYFEEAAARFMRECQTAQKKES